MARNTAHMIDRRIVVGGLAAVPLAIALSTRPSLAAGSQLAPTPRQSEGPFYPVDWSGDTDNDLVRMEGAQAEAEGQVVHISGRILDTSGAPIPGALVEIWQTDAHGRYRHPGDRGERPRDPSFQGRGRTKSGEDGTYSFRTVRPVAYSGRTPHIHFAVLTPGGSRLVTQMYLVDEPTNERDPLLRRLREQERDRLLVRLEPAGRIEPGALAGAFDIVMANNE